MITCTLLEITFSKLIYYKYIYYLNTKELYCLFRLIIHLVLHDYPFPLNAIAQLKRN